MPIVARKTTNTRATWDASHSQLTLTPTPARDAHGRCLIRLNLPVPRERIRLVQTQKFAAFPSQPPKVPGTTRNETNAPKQWPELAEDGREDGWTDVHPSPPALYEDDSTNDGC